MARLSVETDVHLLRFALEASGASPVIASLNQPKSRLARLLDIDSLFEQACHGFSDWYYDSVGSAFALTAENFALGNVLRELPPGSALVAALDAVWLDRPEFVADYTCHPSFHAEGAFTLTRLPQAAHITHTTQLDLKEGWLQAQQLGRELLLLGDPSKDWPSVIALGIHDESHAICRRHYTQAPIDRRRAHYDSGPALWAKAVADAERAPQIVEALEKHLGIRCVSHVSRAGGTGGTIAW